MENMCAIDVNHKYWNKTDSRYHIWLPVQLAKHHVFFIVSNIISQHIWYLFFMCMFFRYQRGNRSLAANLSMSQSATTTAAVTPEMETQEQEEDYDIPEEVETVIGQF